MLSAFSGLRAVRQRLRLLHGRRQSGDSEKVDGGPADRYDGRLRCSTGEIDLEATDLKVSGFGLHWGHARSYANRQTVTGNCGNEFNSQVKEWPYLLGQENESGP